MRHERASEFSISLKLPSGKPRQSPTCDTESKTGHGLTFDKATVARIYELAAMYMVDVLEDTSAEAKNLRSSQATENK
jgi:hypothetical protein